MDTVVKETDIIQEFMELLKQQNVILQELKKGNGKTKQTPAQFSTATLLHGPGGIFSTPGLSRDIITAYVRPYGLASQLLHLPSVDTDPRFGSITGFTDVEGSEPEHACDDAPAGYMKGCNLTARFGMVRRDSQTIEMDKVMLRLHRGDFTDLVLRGRVLGLFNEAPSGLSETDMLNVVSMSEMVGVGVQTERVLNRLYWTGSPAIGTQFPGLDLQIATGQVDADLNTPCSALDSDVKSFAYNFVCGTVLDIVEYLSMMEFYLRNNAEKMGLMPVVWALVMRPELWFELSACWPCRYLTNRCTDFGTNTNAVVINDNVNVAMRDAMRNGLYIDINGNRYPVVLDTGIFEHTNANNANLNPGEFASSIYFVPLTITGNFPVTYIEYVDYTAAQPDRALLQGKEDWWWTDAGRFSWALEQVKWCWKFSLKTEPRIILRTPQLAGKIQYVKYSPLQHIREPFPDSPYWMDGGVSLRPTSNPYAVWWTR